jgi:DNA-binding GntR family transcriptional regulator
MVKLHKELLEALLTKDTKRITKAVQDHLESPDIPESVDE